MSVVRNFGYKERRRQIRQSRTNNRQWHLVSAASVSWMAILRASADERAQDKTMAWISRSALSSISHTLPGEIFRPLRCPILSHISPYLAQSPYILISLLVSQRHDPPPQGHQLLPLLIIPLRILRPAPTSYRHQRHPSSSRDHNIAPHQQRFPNVLMPSETVPQAHDERADQLVGSVDRIKLRQLATPQPFHHLNWSNTPTAGVAILPRVARAPHGTARGSDSVQGGRGSLRRSQSQGLPA